MKLRDQMQALWALTVRNLKMFLLDKAAVFFSLLAPLIVLLLFLLFLGDMQVDAVIAAFDRAGVPYAEKAVHTFVNSWMFAGVMGTACITVSFGANGVMVDDRKNGLFDDYAAAPVKGWVVTAAYYLFNWIVTSIICLSVLGVCFVYLGAAGQFCLSVADGFALIGLTLLSCLSATVISVFLASFFKSSAAFSAFIGILSAVIGFLIGAYMPLSMYPKAIQYIVLFIPGSYSAAIFRRLLMAAPLEQLTAVPQMSDELAKSYSMTTDFFGRAASSGLLWGLLVASVALFIAVDIVVRLVKKK